MKWHKDYLARVKQSIADAKKEASLANYLGECGANAGLRAIYSKKSLWLYDLIFAAEAAVAEQEKAVLREKRENGDI